ncbi:adenosylcobalamin-dependent ribonucleoside-diphosphate reductase [Candidatus Woesearchaeota archaeon]|nr:adenosylcobalamin-dependent ribonucleoside-diphosphate reductase [Candidatus Woesearchaeota archaeon]
MVPKAFDGVKSVHSGKISKIIKRDGRVADFDTEKITSAIMKAARAVGGSDRKEAERLTQLVVDAIAREERLPTVEEIQDAVEKVLIEEGHAKTAKAYILYRAKRAELRQAAAESAKGGDGERTALLDMFAHKSKLASIIGYDRIEAYKNLLFLLREKQKSGELPLHPGDYLGGNELATNIFEKKYYLKDLNNKLIEKRPEAVYARLAAFMAAVEPTPEKQQEWAARFYRSLYEGHFVPGGRVIAGGGDLYRLKTLANCFVSLISEDNIEAIYQSAYECARTYSFGGGIGVDISVLRPKGSVVHNAADTSTGSVSFMELFSLTTGLIGQSGRRGALMLTIDIKHPDSPHFINVKKVPNWVTNQIVEQCKWSGQFSESQLRHIEKQVRENTQIRFANISLKVNDEFMLAVEEQNKYGQDKILVYLKDKGVSSLGIMHGGAMHYSYGIPSKPIEKYRLLKSFNNVEELNAFLSGRGASQLTERDFSDISKRDMFGDIVIHDNTSEFDLAVKKAGDFMLYYNSRETNEIKRLVKGRDIWNAFIEGNYRTAEPGLIFWSTMTKYSPSNYVGRPIASTNPCGEVPLEDGGACNLASVNLSRFVKNGYTDNAEIDWESLKDVTALTVRFLDNVVTWNELLNPLEKQRKAAYETRRLGVGVMGIADMMNQLGLAYDSEEAVGILDEVARLFANTAYQASAGLAEEKSASPIFDYQPYSKGAFFQEMLTADTKEMIRTKGLRNIAILSIAPTGTISNIVLGYKLGDKNFIGVSGGIEPVFALYYTRRSEGLTSGGQNMFFKIFHSTVDAYIQQKGLDEKAQKCQTVEELQRILPPHFFRTAHHIDPGKRVLIQGLWQKYIDHSISSTVNLAEDIEPETISNIYLDAWKHGLKGITIYREGSRYPILSTGTQKTAFDASKDETYDVEIDGEQKLLKGDSIITLPNGKLTTVYHAAKNGQLRKDGGRHVFTETTLAAEPLAAAAQPQHVMAARNGHNLEVSDITASDMKLSLCPSCSKKTLKIENGCHSCLNEECGFSKCDV